MVGEIDGVEVPRANREPLKWVGVAGADRIAVAKSATECVSRSCARFLVDAVGHFAPPHEKRITCRASASVSGTGCCSLC